MMTLCWVLTHYVPKCLIIAEWEILRDVFECGTTHCEYAWHANWRRHVDDARMTIYLFKHLRSCKCAKPLLSTLCTGLQYIPKARVCLGRYPPYHTSWLVKSVNEIVNSVEATTGSFLSENSMRLRNNSLSWEENLNNLLTFMSGKFTFSLIKG
jgi:hypothetical protein